jgi:hypothetical protein
LGSTIPWALLVCVRVYHFCPVEVVSTAVIHTASGDATKADIRIIVAALTGAVAFAGVSGKAAPLLPNGPARAEIGACSPIEKVVQERRSASTTSPAKSVGAGTTRTKSFPAAATVLTARQGGYRSPGDQDDVQPALGLVWRGQWRSGVSVLER